MMDGTLPAILPFLDAGLYPFVKCDTCDELMPVNVSHGPFGTVLVTCCRCRSPLSAVFLQFLTSLEAAAAGWLFQETETSPAN